MIEPKDVHYEYDSKGYMIYYKDKPIGGVGIDKHARGCRANVILFKEQAELEKKRICSGIISDYMKSEIEKIDKGER